jgi:predicted AAA+ superfamily ATPase
MLENFIKYLAINIGGLISYEKISLQLGISFQTIKKYLNAMEKSYLIIPVLPFFTNKTKEITKQPKIYFLDTGLRNSITKTFGNEPDGKLFENYVLSELVKLGLPPKYWRTKSKVEVDFVVERENAVIPIEVKINAAGKIESGMRSFIESYRPKKALIVSLKGAAAEKAEINGCEVFFTNPGGLHEFFRK